MNHNHLANRIVHMEGRAWERTWSHVGGVSVFDLVRCCVYNRVEDRVHDRILVRIQFDVKDKQDG